MSFIWHETIKMCSWSSKHRLETSLTVKKGVSSSLSLFNSFVPMVLYLRSSFFFFYLQRELMHLEGESYVHETYGSQNRYHYGCKPVNWNHDLYLHSPMGCDTSKDVINTFLAWQSWYSDPRCPSGHSDLVKVERVGNKNEEWGHNLHSP